MEKEEIVLEVMVEDKGKRLDSFVSENIEEITRSYLQTLIDDGNVSVEGKTKIKAGQKLKGNEIIKVCIPEPEETSSDTTYTVLSAAFIASCSFFKLINCINSKAITIAAIINITNIPNKNDTLFCLCIGFEAIYYSSLNI